MKELWVLTREINAYDQEGEYFCDVWDHKPSAEDLKEWHLTDTEIKHLLDNGGGRLEFENEWFFLRRHGR